MVAVTLQKSDLEVESWKRASLAQSLSTERLCATNQGLYMQCRQSYGSKTSAAPVMSQHRSFN